MSSAILDLRLRAPGLYRCIVVLSLVAALHTATGFAQEQDGSQVRFDEVVVTTQKLGSNLSTAPVSAVQLSAADLASQHILTSTDLTAVAPGLISNNSSGFAQTYVRGIGSNFATAGVESSVATYVDGVYLELQGGASLDLVDVANITVLNGPQGTLYGRNATGGVILIETANPTNETGGFLTGEYGNFNQTRLEAAFNLPLSDTFAVRVSAQHKSNDGYITNLNDGSKGGDGHSNYIRLKARWQPSDAFSAVYGVEYSEMRSTASQFKEQLKAPYCTVCAIFPTTPLPTGDDFYVSTQSPGNSFFYGNRYTAHSLTLNYIASQFNVHSVTGYRDQYTTTANDLDHVGPNFLGGTGPPLSQDGTTLTHDTYARTTFDSPLNALLGFSYLRGRYSLFSPISGDALAFFGPGALSVTTNAVKINSYSGYGELNYNFGQGFGVTAGARFNRDEKTVDVTNNPIALLFLGLPPTAGAFTRQANFNAVTPRVVFSYEHGDGYYFVSYNRGEKSGGFGSPLSNPAVEATNPEKLDSFEIGAKNKFLQGRLRTTLNVYYGIYNDIQVQTVDPISDAIVLQNAAKGTLKGIEFTGVLDVTDSINVSGGLSYSDNVFKDFPNAAIYSPGGTASCPAPATGLGLSSCRADLSGTPLPRSPKFLGYFSERYTQGLPNDWSAVLIGTERFTSQTLYSPGGGGPLNLDRQPGYVTFDGTLALQLPGKRTEISLWAQNVFERHYNITVATGGLGAYAIPSMPRTFGIRLSQKF